MTQPKNKLSPLQSTFVCPTRWETMRGDQRKRFCAHCNKHVYNFAQMTRREIEAVVEASRGHLCARITRLPDGSIQMLEDVHPALHLISRRASPLASAVVSALLGVSPALATTPFMSAPLAAQNASDVQAQKSPDGAAATVLGTTVDPQNIGIPGVTLTLTNASSGAQRTTTSNQTGAYRFENVPAGTYSIRAEAQGFKTLVFTEVSVLAGLQQTVEIRFQELGEILSGAVAVAERPLRVLFEESALIVDALVGKSVEAGTERDTKQMKTALHVQEVFKGKTRRKVIYFYHWEWDQRAADFHDGDQLLVFLNPRAEGQDGYELSDANRGLKKLSARDLAAYTLRLQELAALRQDGPLRTAELSAWLVRCAVDPATRWEGVADLRTGFRELQACEEEKKRNAEKANASVATAMAELQAALDKDKAPEPEFSQQLAAQLTAEQKEMLTQTALGLEKLSAQDYELLSLVAHWDQERVVAYLLTNLRQIAATAPYDEAAGLSRTLAEILRDDELDKLTQPFNEEDLYADEYLQESHLSEEERAGLQAKAPHAAAKRKAALQSILRYLDLKVRLPHRP